MYSKKAMREEIVKQYRQIQDLEAKITNITSESNILKKELEIVKDQRWDDIEDCQFQINFKAINAFSIERAVNDKREHTVIAYLTDNGIQSWYFTCSRKTHDRLTEEFKTQILDKKE
jgi:hypothetical protein